MKRNADLQTHTNIQIKHHTYSFHIAHLLINFTRTHVLIVCKLVSMKNDVNKPVDLMTTKKIYDKLTMAGDSYVTTYIMMCNYDNRSLEKCPHFT